MHASRLLRFVVLIALALGPARAQTPPPQYSPGPITDYAAAQPDSKDVLRVRRGERYNSPNSPLPELGEQSDTQLFEDDAGTYYHEPMPFDQSDAVVVGDIASGQAYLSNDKRDIYSEFKLVLQEVLKEPAARHIGTGDSLDVERHGGAIRLPSGKVLIRGISDFSMPLIGKRYLLFLRYDQNAQDFSILRGYQLEGQRGDSDEADQHSKLIAITVPGWIRSVVGAKRRWRMDFPESDRDRQVCCC
jgi:hypothetical protein